MKKQILLFTFTLIVLLISISAVSAADTFVNGSATTSGDGSSWTQAFKTIQEGYNGVTDNNTIYIAAGTYTGTGNKGIGVIKNVTFQGAGIDQTIIDLGASGYAFAFDSYNATIKDLTIKNGNHTVGSAINNYNISTVQNCKFVNNSANGLLGGAIYNTGTIKIISSIFDGNYAHNGMGGAIYNSNSGTLIVEKSTFQNNYAHSDRGAGGAIFNAGIATITGSIFKNNAAYLGGAIFHEGISLKATGNTIDGNQAVERENYENYGGQGGGIYLSSGSFEIIGNHIINNIGSGIYIASFSRTLSISIPNGILKELINFNRIYGNTPYGIEVPNYELGGTIRRISMLNATLNWWGSNGGPNSPGADNTNLESIYYAPWIVMKFNPSVVNIVGGTTTTIVANFLYDNLEGYHDPANGHIPDGTPVFFTTTLGQVGSQSTLKHTVNGIATALLMAWDDDFNPVSGIAYLTATTDAQTLTGQVTITPVANAATVGMQKTGLPVAGLVLALLAVFGGLIGSKRK